MTSNGSNSGRMHGYTPKLKMELLPILEFYCLVPMQVCACRAWMILTLSNLNCGLSNKET
jgi:hypothetical protein